MTDPDQYLAKLTEEELDRAAVNFFRHLPHRASSFHFPTTVPHRELQTCYRMEHLRSCIACLMWEPLSYLFSGPWTLGPSDRGHTGNDGNCFEHMFCSLRPHGVCVGICEFFSS